MTRVLGATPQPTMRARNMMLQYARYVARHLPATQAQPLGHFALEYTGAKRAKYLQAAEYVKIHGLQRRDAGVQMFIKPDRIPIDKRLPDPRAIQFRDPKYCVALAAYLKPIEPHLYKLIIPDVSPYRLIGKGCNQFERARVLRKKWNRFRKPVCIVLDASRFDKHCNVWLLRAEHLVYRLSNGCPYLAELLRWQLKNYCRSDLGLKYQTHGRRMSGDMNTALGNCIIMIIICLATFMPLGLLFDLFNDGDDCIVICESEDLPTFQAAVVTMVDFGMTMKVESVTDQFEKISWCQSQPIFTAKGWKFCREPTKVLSCSLIGQKWYHLNPRGRATYLRGLGECEIILNKGVPVLEAYGAALLRNAGCGKLAHDTSSGEYFRYLRELKEVKSVTEFVPITCDARLSFSKAFGICPSEQLLLEGALNEWTFSLTDVVFDGPVRDEHWNNMTYR